MFEFSGISLLLIPILAIFFFVYDWWRRKPLVENIRKKAVLITGCDSGFGYAAARSLYARGAFVYGGCYTAAGADKLDQETGERLKTIILDVTSTDSIKHAAQYVKETLPSDTEFWGVVNNAGIPGYSGPIEFLTKEDFHQVFAVNLYAMVEVTNAFLPWLKKSKGRIVNVASIAADLAFPGQLPYCACKHAASGFSESLRVEKSFWGIKVSTIKPGFYQTNIINKEQYEARFREKWSTLTPELRQEYGETFPTEYVKAISDMLTLTSSPAIGDVTSTFEHALFSVHPRNVYYPGYMAKLIKCTPGFIFDKIMLMFTARPQCLSN